MEVLPRRSAQHVGAVRPSLFVGEILKPRARAEEMFQQVKALAAPSEGQGWILSIYVVAHKHL